MCIRDRLGFFVDGFGIQLGAVEPGGKADGAGEGLGAEAQMHGAVFFTVDPCLLYTSDAADDRACVNLGGRRIIKKKNITDR